jgi:hypothetical protein
MHGFPHRSIHAELKIFAFRRPNMPGQASQTIRLRVREGLYQYGVDDAIDGRVRAYAEAERGEYSRSKSGTFSQLA